MALIRPTRQYAVEMYISSSDPNDKVELKHRWIVHAVDANAAVELAQQSFGSNFADFSWTAYLYEVKVIKLF